MSFREEVINVEFARLLCNKGLKANPELITKNKKMPDVVIQIQGVKLFLECRFNNRKSLLKDTRRRIEEGLCEVSVAVYYHKSMKECKELEKLKEVFLKHSYSGTVFYQGENGIVEETFNKLNIDEFIELLNKIATQIVNLDILNKKVSYVRVTLEDLVIYSYNNSIWFENKGVLKTLADLLAIEDINIKTQKTRKDIIRIALFVLFDAMIFHESIRNVNPRIQSLSSSTKPYKQFFEEEWNKILRIDYKPIFQLSYNILRALPNGIYETEKILKTIKELALNIINSGVLARHDFMGRIYHKLLLKTTGQYYATYYTAVPSAYLLANLLLKTHHKSWNFNELKDLDNFRIIDPACGSGTLLSACYIALRYIYLDKLGMSEFDKFHKIMIENNIYGLDVLNYATHLTLTILSLHNPRVLINKSNIFKLRNGIDCDNVIRLGSISMLDESMQLGVCDKITIKSLKEEKELFEPNNLINEKFDVVIMNPPFSRSANPNIKFGYCKKEVKQAMDKKLKEIIKALKLTGIGQAGLGAVFIILGDKLLKKNGRIGIVIPRSALTGVSWNKIRDILFKKYEIKYIISNHDVGDRAKGIEGWNWSEDTKLGEVMIIAEKTEKDINNKVTTYVNLWNKPENEIISLFITSQILGDVRLDASIYDGVYRNIYVKDKEVGAVYSINQKHIKDNWLAPCLFASPILNELATRLPSLFKVDKLSKLLKKGGIDIKSIKQGFSKTNNITTYRIVWGQQSLMNKLYFYGDEIGYGKPKHQNSYKIFEENKSTFLLSSRPHLDNDCIIAAKTNDKVLASAFWELRFIDESIEPLMVLWFNSTFGLIMYLSASTSSQGGIFKTKKGQFKYMNVLNIEKYSKDIVYKASKLYEEIKDKEFKVFYKEFKLAYLDKGIRKRIDDFFIKEMNIQIDLKPYYNALSVEPALTRKRL